MLVQAPLDDRSGCGCERTYRYGNSDIRGAAIGSVKDPLAQRYYRFEEEEFRLLEMLDGRASLVELQQRFQERFSPQKISLREIHQLVAMLHRSSLVVADTPGQGSELLKRHRLQLHKERVGAITNILCVRFKGYDPDRLLGWLDRRVGWLFSPPCVAFSLVLAIGALLLIGVQFDTFRSKLPAFREFFAAGNWVWIVVTLAATKVLHEFGHGLACKRFGGECHEMGLMILVLTPCLYCNVSDSWMLPSKWRRAAIGAAGIYVEIVLAALATYAWWFSRDGLLNSLCLNVMFVCSVATLLFNANPLLRYDGYYILSDLLEIPNLRQKANAILRRKLGNWLLGLPETPDPFLPHRHQLLFAIYSVVAALYRWFVVLGILWFVYHLFEPYGLKVIGQLIVVVSVYGLVVQPMLQLIRFLQVPGRYQQVKRIKLVGSLVGLAALIACVFGVATPHYVRCDVYLQPRDAVAAYVESPGSLAAIHVRPGDRVTSGQPLVSLQNVDTELQIERLLGQQQQLASKLQSLRQRAFADRSAAAEIAEVEEELDGVAAQLTKRRQEQQKLQIVAPRDGFVIPVASLLRDTDERELASWSGSALEKRNLRAFMETGELICQIGDPRQVEAVLAIDQGEMEFVEVGQPVQLVLNALPGRYDTELARLASLDMAISPAGLSSKTGGELATRTDRRGAERPLSTTYQGSSPLEAPDGRLLGGTTGRARIRVGRQTVAQRAWRFVCQTFSFDV